MKTFKAIHNNGWKIRKFDDTEIEKYIFHQYKRPISKDKTDVNKIVVSNKIYFDKMILNILLVIKMLKENRIFFWENASLLLKYQKKFKLWTQKFYFLKHKKYNHFGESSVSWSITNLPTADFYYFSNLD